MPWPNPRPGERDAESWSYPDGPPLPRRHESPWLALVMTVVAGAAALSGYAIGTGRDEVAAPAEPRARESLEITRRWEPLPWGPVLRAGVAIREANVVVRPSVNLEALEATEEALQDDLVRLHDEQRGFR